jgi:hypothetical protein
MVKKSKSAKHHSTGIVEPVAQISFMIGYAIRGV